MLLKSACFDQFWWGLGSRWPGISVIYKTWRIDPSGAASLMPGTAWSCVQSRIEVLASPGLTGLELAILDSHQSTRYCHIRWIWDLRGRRRVPGLSSTRLHLHIRQVHAVRIPLSRTTSPQPDPHPINISSMAKRMRGASEGWGTANGFTGVSLIKVTWWSIALRYHEYLLYLTLRYFTPSYYVNVSRVLLLYTRGIAPFSLILRLELG
jgi:hypothetical protein